MSNSLRTCHLGDKSSAHKDHRGEGLWLGLLCYLKEKSTLKAFFQVTYSPVTCSLPLKACQQLCTESFLFCLCPKLSSFFDLSLHVSRPVNVTQIAPSDNGFQQFGEVLRQDSELIILISYRICISL